MTNRSALDRGGPVDGVACGGGLEAPPSRRLGPTAPTLLPWGSEGRGAASDKPDERIKEGLSDLRGHLYLTYGPSYCIKYLFRE